VPFSFEVQGDGLNFMQELGKLLVDGAEQLNATAYTTGSGPGQPTGIITSLVASAGTVPLITPGTPETLVAGDEYAVQNALPPRFQPRASWNANTQRRTEVPWAARQSADAARPHHVREQQHGWQVRRGRHGEQLHRLS
jgi:HK97 family phage major capsid protein